MFSNKSWYEYSGSHFNLKESDFICSEKEINNFLSFYRKIIDFINGDYNYNFIKRGFPFFLIFVNLIMKMRVKWINTYWNYSLFLKKYMLFL